MRGMSVVRKAAVVVAALVVIGLVVSAGLATVLVRRPLPDHAGVQRVDGLDGEVEVVRDERGVAHVYASTDADLMRAQGYVHAQDRFFEMDYRRHVSAGRLSELVGENENALAADSVVRTMGWRRVAEQEWEMLEGDARALYEAYAEGVNTYIETREASELGVEYTVLGMSTDLQPVEPWTPVDSISWLKAIAWDLSGNLDDELGRAAALRPLAGNVSRVEELFPEYAYDLATPIVAPQEEAAEPAAVVQPEAPAVGTPEPEPEGTLEPEPEGTQEPAPDDPGEPAEADVQPDEAVSASAAALDNAAQALAAVPGLLGSGEGIGSNSFAVAGEHTATGAPLLANDPHMTLPAPNVWHQVGLHCTETGPACTFDVTGVSFAGMPGVMIGRNPHLAWGLTTLPADVTDLTLERLYDDGTYLSDGGRVPLETRRETIEVNGGPARVITVSSTKHGPVISEVLPEMAVAGTVPVPEGAPPAGFSGYAVALQWTALTPGRTAEAVFALNRARDAAGVAAAAALLEVPSQNIVFATADGDIGYQAPGRIPIRGAVPDSPVPADGSWPRPGWDARFDWQGFVPPEQMPAVLNPPEGFIVAANQAVMPAGQGPFLTSDWTAGYRAERIRGLIERRVESGEPFDVEAMNAIMLDDASPFGPAVVPALLQVDVDDAFVAEAVDVLRTWSAEGFPTSTDSAGAAYFNAVWANLLELTFADDLPASQAPSGGGRWLRVVTRLLEDPSSPWWDDRTTVNLVEGRDEILRQAMVTARQQLTNALGKDPADWEWGKLHRYAPTHRVLGGEGVPAAVRRLMNPTPVGVAGGGAVVNATHYDAAARDELGRGDYTVVAGPSVRLVADMAEPDASTWVVATGTSGHPGSDAYTDQIAAWANGETFPWPSTPEGVDAAREATLTLRPPE